MALGSCPARRAAVLMAAQSGPRSFVPKTPISAMEVRPPYSRVATWCGGRVITRARKFDHILIERNGRAFEAREGQVIAQHPKVDGFSVWDAEEFFDNYREVKE